MAPLPPNVPDSQHLIIHQHHQDVTTTSLHVNPLFRDDSEDLITSIYNHKLNYKLIDRHKMFKPRRRVGSNSSPQTYQKQYHTHWVPMTIEKWAIPIFAAAGLKKASATATKRSDIHCACCEICSDWKGKEPQAEPFEDMCVCDVCNRTYHWSCLLRLGCYKDEDRESVEKDETWACPACACPTDLEKESRHHFENGMKNLEKGAIRK